MATTTTGTAATARFDALLDEAIRLSERIHESLANGEYPAGLNWGHVGDMAETVKGLRSISDRIFLEGEYASEGQR